MCSQYFKGAEAGRRRVSRKGGSKRLFTHQGEVRLMETVPVVQKKV